MNANNQQTEQEMEMVETQYWADQYEALTRLESNKDFQLVILQGYFKDRALDNVSMLGTHYAKSSGTRPEIMESLVAISSLQDHFNTIKKIGGIAEEDISDLEGPEVE